MLGFAWWLLLVVPGLVLLGLFGTNSGRGLLSLWVARGVEKKLHGYRRSVAIPNAELPTRVATPTRVAVVGSGIAGLTAATLLAERGFSVVIYERNAYLGGKVAAWREVLDGEQLTIEHGFHAFFRQYYNLDRMLAKVGAKSFLVPIDDYAIMERSGALLGFKNVAKSPVLNLLSLASSGFVGWRDLLFNSKLRKLRAMLEYDSRRTYADFDQLSFAEFAKDAGLPPRLRLAFNTFARAFFSDESRMSMAELIKGFHFYYLSNDCGLLYDYLKVDSDEGLIAPFVRHLRALGTEIKTSTCVSRVDREGEKFVVAGESFDAVVVASNATASREIVLNSPAICEAAPVLKNRLSELVPGQRYAVLRLWLDRDVPRHSPVFVITERTKILDAITFNHWFQPEAKAWAEAHKGGVYEAHCYALPDDFPEAAVTEQFLVELKERLPELRSASVIHSHLQLRNDFTSFQTGRSLSRPGGKTEIDRLVLAGDWVALEHPALLMEAACMSGILAANEIAQQFSVRGELVEAVPARGLLAG